MKLLTWLIVSLIIVGCAVGATVFVEGDFRFIKLSNGLECVAHAYGRGGVTCNWNAYNSKIIPMGEVQ